MNDKHVDVAIIGAGTAGLYALREVRRVRKSFALIDHGPLGTTCARVGCMPSKIALHSAELWRSQRFFAESGISGGEHLRIDVDRTWANLRLQRDRFAGGAAKKAVSAGGEHLISGRARFLEPGVLEVNGENGRQIVRADACIIASGSLPVMPKWLSALGDRVINTDRLFELEHLPSSLAVLGLGAIGLEMGLALSRLGLKVIGAEMAAAPAGIVDPEIAERVVAQFAPELEMWLGAAAEVELRPEGVAVRSQGREVVVEKVLAALGRRPNIDGLDLAAAGLSLNERGLPAIDRHSMQADGSRLFFAGDASGFSGLMHEAADEGAIAGYNAARAEAIRFRRRTPLAIAFTHPDIATAGARFDQLDPQQIIIGTAATEETGRYRVLHGEGGLLRVYAEKASGRLLGASIFAVDGEHLAHHLAWAIDRGETAERLLQMPFYHPVTEEVLQSALQSIVRSLPAANDLPVGLSAL
ncbi:MAG: Dihydrolipoyl dehydrogenase [Betaproteobacteria bacterium ADurb.Bin341]|nr:MAG: Dihydrolipoyl dehydrogenase [Betaproteobacteria bacterium ADurb.Bin341]